MGARSQEPRRPAERERERGGRGLEGGRKTDRQTDDHAEALSQCHSSSPFSRLGAASSTHSSMAVQHNQTLWLWPPVSNTQS